MFKHLRVEHAWWLGIILWIAAVLFWAPRPNLSYLDAPSASPKPSGFAIFHDLVVREAPGVRRLLGKTSELPSEVGVLVILSPTEPVKASHRKEMLQWVTETGGTLIIGHPIKNTYYAPVKQFTEGTDSNLCPVRSLDQTHQSLIDYVESEGVPSYREIPTFAHDINRTMDMAACEGATLLMDEVNEVVATYEKIGEGTVIQLSQADLLGNEAIGTKQTHLFAAALIDLAGKKSVWAFDEAHEGIMPQPKFIALVGSSHYRFVFLQILLLIIIGYWWRTTRIGSPRSLESNRGVREVATKARDTGDFYLRAGKSRWALSCSVEYLKLSAAERGISGKAKKDALALIETGKNELKQNTTDMEKHAQLIRKIAKCQRALLTSRGKTK